MRLWRRRRVRRIYEIAPEEIFLDSSNLPEFDARTFEGRVERPVSGIALFSVGAFFVCVLMIFGAKAYSLQIVQGEKYANVSRNNSLDRSVLFATRGMIFDRTGRELAWNESLQVSSSTASSTVQRTSRSMYSMRKYIDMPGLAHILGYVQYPKADASGAWWREDYTGVSGVEYSLDNLLRGQNGHLMLEVDALGNIERENIIEPPLHGTDVKLSIHAEIQSKLAQQLSSHAERNNFRGGAAVIMDVHTGEIIALTSFPEYDNQAFTDGDQAAIRQASVSTRSPLLNRAIGGLYTPGSIVKPVFAIAALNENIISPEKTIVSTGKLVLPNPYDPSNPSIFRDWTVHGPVDMRTAIAVSSDEYFYVVGGGFGSQKGLGIRKIDEYSKIFGMTVLTGVNLKGEAEGIIPTPEWKVEVFGEDDPWRIGNTYHTSIGQFGFLITPIQAVRFTAAIANGGKMLTPQILASSTPQYTQIDIPEEYFQIAREGMRMAVTSTRHDATVKSLNIGGIEIAAKTGTAELGARKEYMNSWSVGYWPASAPKYAYAVVLEKAPAGTLSGASPGLLPFFQWLISEHPEYLR